MIEEDEKTPVISEEDVTEDEGTALLGLQDDEIARILEALDEEDADKLTLLFENLGPYDKADLLEKVNMDTRTRLLDYGSVLFQPEVFTYIQEEVRRRILENMEPGQIAGIISELDSDDALDLILPLEEEFKHEVIRKLSAKTRLVLQEGLSFPEESAGRLMQREFVAVPQFWTVGKTIDYLRAAAEDLPDTFYDLIVIDPSYHIAGEIPLHRLVRARRSEKIESLTLDDTHPIPATMDQEEVAEIFRNEDLASAPVVDEDGRLIGIITYDDVIDVIDEEAQEDLLKLGGIEEDDLYRSIMSTSSSRFRWLFINLFTAFLAASVISLFTVTIEKVVALAVLMPIVAGMGGNAGTQALTVAVRALATRELSSTNAWRVIGKEVAVGFVNGAIFAIMVGLVAGIWFHDPKLGAVIASAMVTNLVVAGFFGASVPIVLDRYDIDPAIASGVFLTAMTDCIGFLTFLGLASLFLL
ncbi:MAG: magnesium transporter [Micavibrio aeruginosavorus]|uniref:Magnesium transporter MgtE n=1 Tax=Micavibrio aeruginosavorus TaxID=349221 RepID=A0A2W5HKY7_9BACT|nr:MAG: magnesium transporter [Micavibrio aeruginosavorus]